MEEVDAMTQEEMQEISRLWKEGVPAKQIAYAMGYKPRTIYRFACVNRDLCPYRTGATPEKVARMWELRNSGMTWLQVANELGVGVTTLDRWRKQ